MGLYEFLFFAVAVGFALAGLTASAFELVAGKPLRFAVRQDLEPLLLPIVIVLRLVAGPLLLIKVALGLEHKRAVVSRVLCCLLACLWSGSVGVLLLA